MPSKTDIESLIPFNKNEEKASISTDCTAYMEDENFSSSEDEYDGNVPPPPDLDYGYEDASPDIALRRSSSKSLKKGSRRGSVSNTSTRRSSRRQSSDSQASQRSQRSALSANSCPETAERRSSIKMPGRARRASIQFSGEIEIHLPGEEGPVRRRTSISFNETVKVKRVAPVHELTDEPEELWFQDDEYDKIRRKSFKICEKFIQGEKIEGKKLCTRGLESILNHESRSHAKVDAWESVLNEQHMQREDGQFDDEYLSKVYKFSTRRSSNEAMARANQDQKEVEKYLQSTRRICRRLTVG